MKTMIFFLLLGQTLWSQGIEVVYIGGSINTPELLKYAPGLEDTEIIYKLSLKINNGKSIYNKDSVLIVKKHPMINGGFIGQTIYKDYEQNSHIECGAKFQEGKCYSQSINEVAKGKTYIWLYTDEEKLICGIRCKKATFGDNTAWYSMEHPYQDGPMNGVFSLPGLVLEYKATGFYYHATDIKPYNEPITFPSDLQLYKSESKILNNIYDPKSLVGKNYLRYDSIPLNVWTSLPSLNKK